MSLFGDLANSIKGTVYEAAEGGAQGLIGKVVDSQAEGGLGGLLAKLQDGGMGAQVSSWLGEGHNLPVSADQLQGVLGNEQVQKMAGSLGLSSDQILQGLSEHLPAIADALPKSFAPGGPAEQA